VYGTTIQKNTIFCFSTIFFSQSHEKIIFLKSQPSCIHYSMTSSPSLTSNNFIITHHLNTLHNNVGNYFEFICMKTSLTMFDNSDTFENFFLFGCYKLSSVNHHQQTFSFMIINNNFMIINKLFHSWSTTTSKNFFIHDHQQQLHDHQQLHPSKTFSFMIINNNNFIHPCQVHTFSLAGPTVWLTQLS
jgi:hypothetical protein